MKKTLVIAAGSLLFATTVAMAAPAQHHHDRGHQQNDQGRDHRGNQGHRRFYHDQHGEHDGYGRYYVVQERGRHEGGYQRGGRVPIEYRGPRYIVTDWRAYRLREPPRGYAWVRSDDGQYLLIALATGIIVDMLLSH
jgi:Ni/Co efflux regulator RcnB